MALLLYFPRVAYSARTCSSAVSNFIGGVTGLPFWRSALRLSSLFSVGGP